MIRTQNHFATTVYKGIKSKFFKIHFFIILKSMFNEVLFE